MGDENKLAPKMSHAIIVASTSGKDASNGSASAEKAKNDEKESHEASSTTIEDIGYASNSSLLQVQKSTLVREDLKLVIEQEMESSDRVSMATNMSDFYNSINGGLTGDLGINHLHDA
ncbi:hypothetical protein V6N13_033522 [Hibiscus sabdariffa]|uniref:Uncharacterized protein n=1 Tax=Hibiscus sabdariffa TaxID=183260 RepID=A0ABR2FA73_9ROSI